MGFSLSLVLFFKIFDLLLEKPDFTSVLQFQFIQLALHFNSLVDLLFNFYLWLVIGAIHLARPLTCLTSVETGWPSSTQVQKYTSQQMQQRHVMVLKRSHTMENLYKSLKESWKCFRFLLVSIGLSISSVGSTCCHLSTG
jgi:hypothetical protein